MREGWETVQLGELLTKRTDFTPIEDGVSYRCAGVQRSGWGIIERDPFIGGISKFTKLMRLEKDDFVYRVITAFEAPSAVVDDISAGLYVSPQTFPVFKVSADRLLPGYLRMLTTDPSFHHEMSERCVGSVLRRMTLSVGALLSIPIALPPLVEQQRIVDLIGSLDQAIESADASIEASKTTVSELRRHLLTPKESWRRASVEEMCHKITSGGTPNRNVPGYYTSDPSGIPWVKSSELIGGIISDTSEHITKGAVSGSSAKLLPAGTVLMAMYCLGTLGSVGILGREMACNQASCAMIPDTEIVLPEILSYLLANDRAHLENISAGAVQRNINAKTVKALTYSLPGLAEQLEIVDLVVAAERVVREASAAAASLQTARSELLTVLLSGDHEIPESYDVDTSVQLEPAA